MRRRVAVILFALLLMGLLALPCGAVEAEIGAGVDPEEGLDEEIVAAIGDFDSSELPELGGGIGKLLLDGLRVLSGSVRSGLLSCALMLAAVLLCGLMQSAEPSDAVRFAGVLAIVSAGAGGVQSMITLAGETLNTLREYSLILLPGLVSLSVFSGTGATGAGVYAGSVVFFDVLLRVASALLLPLVWAYIAACAADTAIGDGRLRGVCDFLKWAGSSVLKWTSYLFTGYLSVTGVACGAVDAVKLRAARAALSGAVPVVGGIISDASDALLSAAGTIKNAVGVYGMLAVLAICIAPFFRLGVQAVLLRGTAAISGLFGQPQLTGLIERLCDAMGLLLALTGAFCAAALLSLVLCMKAAGV